MAIERTFSIIKPDAVKRNKIGEITAMLESAGLRIVASKRILLDQNKAASFYGVHSDKPFFQSLCDFMCSGPIVVQVLEGDLFRFQHFQDCLIHAQNFFLGIKRIFF